MMQRRITYRWCRDPNYRWWRDPNTLFRLDFLLAGAFAAAMYYQDAPCWAITLLIFMMTRASRVEVGPAAREAIVEEMLEKLASPLEDEEV